MNPSTATSSSPAPKVENKPNVSQKASDAVGKLLPKNYDTKKAILAAVITLIVFTIGVLAGTYFPWWIAVILGAAVVFGGFVGMAQFDTAFACSKTLAKPITTF